MADVLQNVLRNVPKALAFVVILVVGWLVARAVRSLVGKILERTGFDRFVERGGVKAALARSRYDASDLVAKLAYYAVALIALQLAFGIWGPNPVSALITAVVAWLPRAFVAILIMVVAAAIARAVKDVVGGALGGLSYGRFLAGGASVMILGLGGIAALNQVGVATTVTTPVLIAVLATIGGVVVVGVGGGLVRPMQDRWEGWLSRAEAEAPAIAEQARAYEAGKRDAEAAQAALREEAAAREAAGRVAAEQADVEATMPLIAGLSAEETMVIPADATRELR
jgi:mechanosensitive ion channel-like protein